MSNTTQVLDRGPVEQVAPLTPRRPLDLRRWRAVLLPVGALLVWGAFWVVAEVTDVAVTEPGWQLALQVSAEALAALAVVLLLLLARRRPRLAADLGAMATAGAVSGLMTMALHGTRWMVYGLYADGSFRTEMATRYAQHWGLVSYAYKGLPAYYPPALGWLEGRLADLTGLAGWETIKPMQLVLGALVPLLAYALWSRVLPAPRAALVVAATVAVTVNLQKPDEWLVLACIVPWWLDLVRGVRAPGVRPWPAWGHGVVAGLLLLTHTFFFLPVAVASVLALAVDVARYRRPRLRLGRAAVVCAVGLAVSAPYWGAMVLEKLRGAPADDLQMRYTYPGANTPYFPLPPELPGTLGAIGVLWLAWSLWRWRRGHPAPLAGGLGLLLGGALLTLLIGHEAITHGIGMLTFKTKPLVAAVYTVTGVLGLVEAARFVRERARAAKDPRWVPAGRVLVGLVAAAVAVFVAAGFVTDWVVSNRALVPQTTRYPDGTWPAGRHALKPVHYPGYVLPGDPSVQQVRDAWRRASGGRTATGAVLVTSRVDLLATTPVHPFIVWKSIYSDPIGQFDGRLRLLRRAASCTEPRCAARLLAHNRFDTVDGLVLERHGDRLVLPLEVDNFPNKTRPAEVAFRPSALRGPQFVRVDVGRLSVVALR
jgi:galactan 5-O-arabinofuranosyltransferase